MKKFRLAAAVSVAVLTMSVQAMATPLSCNISSGSSCPTTKTVANCTTNSCQNLNSTLNGCFSSMNLESLLSQLNCANGTSVKGATTVKGTTKTKGSSCTTRTKCSNTSKAAKKTKATKSTNCTTGSNCTTSSNCATGCNN